MVRAAFAFSERYQALNVTLNAAGAACASANVKYFFEASARSSS
jgi:hypothetical protein